MKQGAEQSPEWRLLDSGQGLGLSAFVAPRALLCLLYGAPMSNGGLRDIILLGLSAVQEWWEVMVFQSVKEAPILAWWDWNAEVIRSGQQDLDKTLRSRFTGKPQLLLPNFQCCSCDHGILYQSVNLMTAQETSQSPDLGPTQRNV